MHQELDIRPEAHSCYPLCILDMLVVGQVNARVFGYGGESISGGDAIVATKRRSWWCLSGIVMCTQVMVPERHSDAPASDGA
eukprot:1159727-Pelagomonas_calceolata.AAC.8